MIPGLLTRNVTRTWGADGRRWLAELPALVAEIACDWQLVLGAPYAMSLHWVAAVTRADGSAAVLKLGVPHDGHLATEAAALESYAGLGAVKLLEHDLGRGALLLEHAAPGTPVAALVPDRDETATAAVICVLKRLRRAPARNCPLPDLAEYGVAFSRHLRDHPSDHMLPRHLVERAGKLFEDLCGTATDRVVLHGDLHHDNILHADREPWLAIDPHGVIGDPGYELGAMLYNPDPGRRDDKILALLPARLEQLADGLQMPFERVVAWGFVKAVLSEVWTAQGGGNTGTRALDVALRLYPHLP